MSAGREAELAAALIRVEHRIDTACRAADRDRATVRLLPVTKYFPASDVEILYRLGRREVGESREQEAAAKVATSGPLSGMRWHMIGRLQRNKAKSVVRWADTVHSVDSPRLVRALDGAAVTALDEGVRAEPLRVLLQVSLDRDPARGGVVPDELGALAAQVAASGGLTLGGVMAVAPLGADPERSFAELAGLHHELLQEHPGATEMSAGMSGDLEAAVACGATCLRVGTALMGARPITSQ